MDGPLPTSFLEHYMTGMLADAVTTSPVKTDEADLTIEKPPASGSAEEPIDIEHLPVKNDPRTWSPFRKVRSFNNLLYFIE